MQDELIILHTTASRLLSETLYEWAASIRENEASDDSDFMPLMLALITTRNALAPLLGSYPKATHQGAHHA